MCDPIAAQACNDNPFAAPSIAARDLALLLIAARPNTTHDTLEHMQCLHEVLGAAKLQRMSFAVMVTNGEYNCKINCCQIFSSRQPLTHQYLHEVLGAAELQTLALPRAVYPATTDHTHQAAQKLHNILRLPNSRAWHCFHT